MKKITIEMYETRFPNGNFDYFNNLSNEDKEDYLNLYSLYSELLYRYIISKLNLKRYDDMIKNSKNNFKEVNILNMDLYQYLASDYLNFFYIRNNLYIERLNCEEIKFLKTINDSNINSRDNINLFIEKTYEKVCLENLDPKNNYDIVYSKYDDLEYYKLNNCILIGYRFDDYYVSNNITDEEWNKQDNNRQFELNCIEIGLSKKCKDILKVPVYFQKYNMFNINKLEFLSKEK